MPKVVVRNVYHSFTDQTGVDLPTLANISFAAESGDFIAIVGSSGCGKTTLLKTIAGLIYPKKGEITIDGVPPDLARSSGTISFMFQNDALLPWRSVWENIALPLELKGAGEIDQTVSQLIALVNMPGFEAHFPSELSGGMRSRVALARSLALSPSLLLLDEPFGALDELTSQDLNLKLNALWLRGTQTIILVTHNIDHAVFLAQRVFVVSSRPAKIHSCIEIALPKARHRDILFTREFFQYVGQVKKALFEAYHYQSNDKPN